jgi:aspartyl-tRNA(Asn)/glutamyl-tRNA(Gln) amidotransferase subunit A
VADLADLTLRTARDLIAARELSATELTELTFRRIEETEPVLHAYVHLDRARALARAAEIDQGGEKGSLLGVPFGVKDVIETKDLATEAGSALLAGNVPSDDAEVVRRLRSAGAICIGKHVTHEFACGQDDPPTRNPWDLDRYPGGSSAGGGVSVQVGSSLLALGTDAGGSVRKPACVTGTVGLKATHGRVPSTGTIPQASSSSLDHVGTFTRSVEDAAIALQVIAGYDARDPRSLDVTVPSYTNSLNDGVAGLRIGVAPQTFRQDAMQPEVASAFDGALSVLQGLGAVLVTVDLPSFEHALTALFTIFPSEVSPAHRRWLEERGDEYHERTRRLLSLGALLPSEHVSQAQRYRALVREETARTFAESQLDALVTPTLPCVPPRFDEMIPGDFGSLIPFTGPWNLTGQPAISVPSALPPSGLPVGLQIVGAPFDEATILRIGVAYEAEVAPATRAPFGSD